jgi:hypothetical protein
MWSNILMKPELSWQILEKCLNTKFPENLTNGSRVIPCRHRMKLIITFRNFVNVPKNPLCTMQIAASTVLKPEIFYSHCVISRWRIYGRLWAISIIISANFNLFAYYMWHYENMLNNILYVCLALFQDITVWHNFLTYHTTINSTGFAKVTTRRHSGTTWNFL